MRIVGNILALALMLWPAYGRAETELKIITTGGYVAFTPADDWIETGRNTRLPIAYMGFKIRNPGEAGTRDSTNLAISLYDPHVESARTAFDELVRKYGNNPKGEQLGAWTVYRQELAQGTTPYTLIDARRTNVADVIIGVRLAWPHLPSNPPNYDKWIESTFRIFLGTVNGRLGLPDVKPGDTVDKPNGDVLTAAPQQAQ